MACSVWLIESAGHMEIIAENNIIDILTHLTSTFLIIHSFCCLRVFTTLHLTDSYTYTTVHNEYF